MHYPIALEGALKLKEISYVHAEGYPTGELRHGPTALLDETPSGRGNCDPRSRRSRIHAPLRTVAVAPEAKSAQHSKRQILSPPRATKKFEKLRTPCFLLPNLDELLLPILEVVPLQLLAYHIAVMNDFNPDCPRNLVKSVTVD